MKKIIGSLLLLSGILAVMHSLHNVQAFFIEESRMLFLSSQEKEQLVYGDILSIRDVIDRNLPQNEAVLFQGNDGRTFFFLRYFSYPREVYWTDDKTRHVPSATDYVLSVIDDVSLQDSRNVLFENARFILHERKS